MVDTHYLWPLAGGILIGTSAGLYLLLDGRIAGISGVVASAAGWTGDGAIRLSIGFVAGIVCGAAIAVKFLRHTEIVIASSPVMLIVAGLIVGFGTRLGSGCTSGHGVCGLARLSPRSMVATAIFMVVACLTVFALRHARGVFA